MGLRPSRCRAPATPSRSSGRDPEIGAWCYTFGVKAKKARRRGATTTFPVSVDVRTHRALQALADQAFGGNLSALVTDLAEDARRRLAAGAFLRKKKIQRLGSDEALTLEAEIAREVLSARARRKPGAA